MGPMQTGVLIYINSWDRLLPRISLRMVAQIDGVALSGVEMGLIKWLMVYFSHRAQYFRVTDGQVGRKC